MVQVALLVLALSAPPPTMTPPVDPPQTTSSRTPTKNSGRSSRSSTAKRGTTKPPATTPPADPPPPAATSTPAPAPPSASTPATTTPARDGADGWLLLIAGVLAAVGGMQWWAVRKGLAETKNAADAAASSAAAAARALAASERAYLVARNWGMRPPAVGEIPEVEFIVENVGRTPARRTLVRGQIEVRDMPLPPKPNLRTPEMSGGTLTIPPGGRPASTLTGDAPLTRDDLDRLRASTAFLSIWGRVDYEDVLGSPQSVSFAWRFDITTGLLTYDTASDAYHEAT